MCETELLQVITLMVFAHATECAPGDMVFAHAIERALRDVRGARGNVPTLQEAIVTIMDRCTGQHEWTMNLDAQKMHWTAVHY